MHRPTEHLLLLVAILAPEGAIEARAGGGERLGSLDGIRSGLALNLVRRVRHSHALLGLLLRRVGPEQRQRHALSDGCSNGASKDAREQLSENPIG